MLKKIVIGLDGATFSLLNPWIDSGDLPNLKKLITGGAHAVMESCMPPVTCPNWKCYSTGKNPGKLGVYWWELVDVNKRTIESVRYAEHIKSKEIWDVMNDHGYRTAVINMPTTYPPKKLKGCMVAGGPDCPNENFTDPQELEKELKEKFDYTIHPGGVAKLRTKDRHAVKEIFNQIRKIFAATKYIMKQDSYDFIHMTIFSTSIVQHFLWNDDIVRKVWASIDKEIGELLSELPEGYGVVIMSDHGMRTVYREFYINKWLEEKGYLALKQMPEFSRMRKRKLYRKKLADVLEKLGLKRWLKKLLHLHGIGAGGNIFDGEGKKGDKANRIDWDRSLAIASGQGPVYMIGSGREDARLTAEMIEQLKGIKDPQTGKNVIEKVLKKEEVYPSILSPNAPDLMLVPDASYRINGDIRNVPLFEDCKRWAAENDPPGIFIAYGKDIQPGSSIRDMKITDIAPTLLHWMNIPIPDDMDGRVLTEIFEKGSGPCARAINMCSSENIAGYDAGVHPEEEEAMVRKRLSDLGYMG